MKKIMYPIALSSAVFTVSMFSTELGAFKTNEEISRPSHLPKNLPLEWGPFEQEAYNNGRLSYNSDSSLCVIQGNRKLSSQHAEQVQQYNEYFDKWNSDSAQLAREKNPTWYMKEFKK